MLEDPYMRCIAGNDRHVDMTASTSCLILHGSSMLVRTASVMWKWDNMNQQGTTTLRPTWKLAAGRSTRTKCCILPNRIAITSSKASISYQTVEHVTPYLLPAIRSSYRQFKRDLGQQAAFVRTVTMLCADNTVACFTCAWRVQVAVRMKCLGYIGQASRAHVTVLLHPKKIANLPWQLFAAHWGMQHRETLTTTTTKYNRPMGIVSSSHTVQLSIGTWLQWLITLQRQHKQHSPYTSFPLPAQQINSTC